jgi:hypothetical protein
MITFFDEKYLVIFLKKCNKIFHKNLQTEHDVQRVAEKFGIPGAHLLRRGMDVNSIICRRLYDNRVKTYGRLPDTDNVTERQGELESGHKYYQGTQVRARKGPCKNMAPKVKVAYLFTDQGMDLLMKSDDVFTDGTFSTTSEYVTCNTVDNHIVNLFRGFEQHVMFHVVVGENKFPFHSIYLFNIASKISNAKVAENRVLTIKTKKEGVYEN